MNSLGTARRSRCLTVWATTTVAAAVVLRWCAPDLPGTGSLGGSFERLVVELFAGVLAGCALWWWAVTTVVVLDAVRAAPARTRGVPPAARRLVLAACGVALAGAGAAPAVATPGALHQDDGRRAPSSLHGLPLPERPNGGLLRADPPEAPGADHATVVVRPGDSLWAIAQSNLGPGATAAEVTAHWHLVHELNRGVIGADPDLIQPGQRLRLPTPPHRP